MGKLIKGEKYGYTNIDNAVFFDNRLSAKAKGVLCQMLSLPDNWEYSVEGLATRFSDGKASIRSAVTELEQYGYLVRKQMKKGGKYAGMDYMIYANPGNAPNTDFPFAENQTAEIQTAEIQTAENRTQLNTNKSNTNKLNTKEYSIGRKRKTSNLNVDAASRPTLDEVKAYISENDLSVDAEFFYKFFDDNEWLDSQGNAVRSWKQKVLTWHRREQERSGTRDTQTRKKSGAAAEKDFGSFADFGPITF